MKKHILFFTCMFFCLAGKAQWVQQNSGTTQNLSDIFFTTADTGYAIEDQTGVIRKTTDGGVNWNITGSSTGGIRLYFLNTQSGFAYASSVLKTMDGGNTWNNVLNGSFIGRGKMQFLNNTTGFFCDHNQTFDSIHVYKTINGGNSWFEIGAIYNSEITAKLTFTDLNTGYILTETQVYKTTNGGVSWNAVYTSGFTSWAEDICFPAADTGYIVTDDGTHIYKTTDGGFNWNTLSTPPSSSFYNVYFLNTKDGYVTGGAIAGIILETSDGGSSWVVTNTPYFISGLSTPTISVAYAAGSGGLIMKKDMSTGISASSYNNFISCYPNPTTGIIHIQAKDKIESVVVTDVAGNEIYKCNCNVNQIDLSAFLPGIYLIKTITGNEASMKKIVKE